MGTSIRLQMLLGDHTVAAWELNDKERVTVLRKVIDKLEPQLQYMPSFKPLTEHIVQRTKSWSGKQVVPSDVRSIDPLIDASQRCYELTGSYATDGGYAPHPELPRAFPRFIRYKDLYLTQEGELILWHHEWETTVGRKDPNAPHWNRYPVTTTALLYTISIPTDEQIAAVVSGGHLVQTLAKLQSMLEYRLEQHQRRANSTREVADFVRGIKSRIVVK